MARLSAAQTAASALRLEGLAIRLSYPQVSFHKPFGSSRGFFRQSAALRDGHAAGEAGHAPGVLVDGHGHSDSHGVVERCQGCGHTVADTDRLHQPHGFVGSFGVRTARDDGFACTFIRCIRGGMAYEVQTSHFNRTKNSAKITGTTMANSTVVAPRRSLVLAWRLHLDMIGVLVGK